VSCFPDIEVHRRTPQDEFLIVACDGVWDVLTSEEAVLVMREILTSGETSTLKCAEEMIDVAHSK
ncbi:ptc3, partial [Symbiodinium microadriaticum]